jgi:hypothetical protein
MKNKFKSMSSHLMIIGVIPFIILLSIVIIITLMIDSNKPVNVEVKKESIKIDTVYVECDKRHFECPEEKIQIKPKKVEDPKSKSESDTL